MSTIQYCQNDHAAVGQSRDRTNLNQAGEAVTTSVGAYQLEAWECICSSASKATFLRFSACHTPALHFCAATAAWSEIRQERRGMSLD